MNESNLVIILSDEHSRDAAGCYGHPLVRTPNIDSLAERGTVFTQGYTNCPICIPARAAMATGEYVHNTGHWDNGQPYDGRPRSWHHTLRDRGFTAASVGKLHFKGQGTDHGFCDEIDPLHVVDGIGDVLGCIRDDMPKRHKRDGIEEAGPGNSTYIEYDAINATHAIRWMGEHAGDENPWVLLIGFVLPHPPYIAPPRYYEHYPLTDVTLPPQWRREDWPDHPVMNGFRDAFDFDEPFSENTVRRVNAAYLGAVEYLDMQIGRVLSAISDLGLASSTRTLYTSDHGEDRGARGLFGKFTMYEESVGIPIILAGPDVPAGKRVSTSVSLIDVHPSVLQTVGLPADPGKPGVSLFDLACEPDRERIVFSEYHALGCQHGFFMVRAKRYKYVYYVGATSQLFDLIEDPAEMVNLAPDPQYSAIKNEMEEYLKDIVDPVAVDARARADQNRIIALHGGRDAVISRGAFDNSPVPGEAPQFHI